MTRSSKLWAGIVSCVLLVAVAGCGGPRAAAKPRAAAIPESAVKAEIAVQEANAALLEAACADMDIASMLKGVVDADARLALASTEADTTLDSALAALIEDELIRSLRKAGYTVVERDSDLTRRHRRERANGVYQLVPGPSELRAATHLVGYRIVECGLQYGSGSDARHMKRDAYIRLNMRIEKAPTGEILQAGPLEGRARDELEEGLLRSAERFRLQFYAHGLPVQTTAEGQ
jgi:curli biogenesis system outer membrane secretion channel CsgG